MERRLASANGRPAIRILILSQYYEPEPISKPHEVAVALAARGHRVSVLTGLPNYPTGLLAPGYGMTLLHRELRDGIPVARVFEVPYHGDSVIGRLANYGSFAISAAVAGMLVGKADVVYVWSPPLTVGIAAAFISRMRGMPFVYDLQDIWPDSLVFAGLRPDGGLAKVMRFAERRVYAGARRILVPTEGAKINVESKRVPSAKVVVLPHWANPDDFVDLQPTDYERSRGLLDARDNDFVVAFAGNVGFAQGLERLIETADRLRDRPRLAFRIIGDGAASEYLKAEIASRGLANVKLMSRRPRRETAQLLASSDLLVVVLKSRRLAEIALPAKTMSYLASGRPILIAAGGAAAELVEASGGGVVVNPDDAAAFAREIVALSEMPRTDLSAMGGRGLAYARAKLLRGPRIDELEAILQGAAGAARSTRSGR